MASVMLGKERTDGYSVPSGLSTRGATAPRPGSPSRAAASAFMVPLSTTTSGLSTVTYSPRATAKPRLAAEPKPRLPPVDTVAAFGSTFATASSDPSVEALSTTMISSTPSARTLRTQSTRWSRAL